MCFFNNIVHKPVDIALWYKYSELPNVPNAVPERFPKLRCMFWLQLVLFVEHGWVALKIWIDICILRTTIIYFTMCYACVAAVKSPRTTSLCSHIFSGPQGSWSVHVCWLYLQIEFRSCARGRQWCGISHYNWWTASIKPRLLFSRAGYASWGLSLSAVFC